MRKLSEKHYNFLKRKAQRYSKKRRIGKVIKQKISEAFSNYPYSIRGRNVKFAAPEKMNLTNDYVPTVRFLKIIRSLGSSTFNSIKVDFTTIKSISPLAALLLTSEVHRWQLSKGPLRLLDEDKWDANVKRLLHEMGFFDLVQLTNKPKLEYQDSLSIKFAPFRSGHITLGEEADALRKNMENMAGAIPTKTLMYGGLTEAMKNVLNWAYNSETPANLRRWWMSGSYTSDRQRMTIMIYDHGVGIPATLPKSTFWERMVAIMAGDDDESMIKAAMQIGRSATRQTHRGKGLADIQKFILESGGGLLRIISGFGEYTITNNGVEKSSTKEIRLDGTLVAWVIEGMKESTND